MNSQAPVTLRRATARCGTRWESRDADDALAGGGGDPGVVQAGVDRGEASIEQQTKASQG